MTNDPRLVMDMLHTWFANPWSFYLLAILPVWGLVAFVAARRRRWTLVRFGTLPAVRTLASLRGGLRFLRQFCFVVGILLLIAGIAGPRWGWDWEQSVAPGRDIVIVLDLSLPGMSGLQAIPILKLVSPRSVVVVFSAYDIWREASLDAGAYSYVDKSDLAGLQTVLQRIASANPVGPRPEQS